VSTVGFGLGLHIGIAIGALALGRYEVAAFGAAGVLMSLWCFREMRLDARVRWAALTSSKRAARRKGCAPAPTRDHTRPTRPGA